MGGLLIMRKYVVTLEACPTCAISCGVWGVFSTYEKAVHAVGTFIDRNNEELYDWTFDDVIWLFFTNKSTWRIESLIEDDEGF
jgi:hypothetical protein